MDFKGNNEKLATDIREALNDSIKEIYNNRDKYVKRPGHDFVRERLLGFTTLIKLILSFGSKTNQTELKDFFGTTERTPNKSALTLQRAKINDTAFSTLFTVFTSKLFRITTMKLMKGYQLSATDGTDILLPKDSRNPLTYIHKKDEEGYNKKHLNCLYDPLNHLYTAFNFDTVEKKDERTALLDMLPSLIHRKVILLADRGYESYNLIAHCIESGIKYAVRAKELTSNSILSGISYLLPDKDEFDTTITIHLTRLKEKPKKGIPNIKVLSPSTNFDYLSKEKPYYDLTIRVVCFTLSSGIKECLITNLSKNEFSFEEMKKLYFVRWGIELSYRDLKYPIDMVHFHSLKEELINQEVAAKLTMYNFCSAICNNIEVPSALKQTSNLKYDRKVNFAQGIGDCHKFFCHLLCVEELCKRLIRFLTPIKPDRQAPRNIRSQRARAFNYRSSV